MRPIYIGVHIIYILLPGKRTQSDILTLDKSVETCINTLQLNC